jgi:hypothetical protein
VNTQLTPNHKSEPKSNRPDPVAALIHEGIASGYYHIATGADALRVVADRDELGCSAPDPVGRCSKRGRAAIVSCLPRCAMNGMPLAAPQVARERPF